MRVSADSMLREEDEQVFFVNHSWWKHWNDSNRVALENIQNKDFTLYRSKPSEQSMIVFDTLSEDNKSELVFQLTGETSSINIETDGVAFEGHNYVLLPGNVWREAFNWYNKESSAKNNIRDGLSLGTNAEGDTLQLHLIVSKQGELTVKISIEDNEGDRYRKACRIFNTDFEQVYIWDLFGQTKNAVLNNDHKFGQDLPDGSEEHLLKLQIYDIWPESSMTLLHSNDSSGKDMAITPIGVSASEPSLVGGSILNVITSRSSSPDLSMSHPLSSPRRNLEGIGNNSTQSGPTGLVGLHNLGNTCFMNSALQCLLHTPKLVEYFLSDYNREINRGNPLGMEGELALAFGDLLRKVWSIGRTPIPPRNFKARLARFAPQFSGYNQHDSQELLAFLLDGLHEDLNRVKDKPYIESRDSDGRLDEEVAEEYWRNHLARNDSIIVDLFQGQFKSTLVCPKCQKVSVMFDPFMYLSLPLPSSTMRPMSLTVCSTDGSRGPTLYTVTVPKHVKCRELLQALSNACALRNEEKLLLAEIYSHKIIRLIEDPLDPSLIRDEQHIAAYRFTNHQDEGPLVEFINRRNESIFSTYTSGYWKPFGMPLLAKIPKKTCTGADILELFEKLLTPLLHESSVSVKENEVNEESKDDVNMEDLCDPESLNNGSMDDDLRGVVETAEKVIPNGHSSTSASESSFKLFMLDDKLSHKEISIDLHETVSFPLYSRKVQVFVNWSEKMLEKYDTCQLEGLSEVSKSGYAAKRQNQEPISLYACLDAFLKEEPLGPEDMWFCPRCEDHCQASKKLDLWRLPEILVVHLKRFSYSRFLKNKLETSVNFPTHDLNLSDYVTQKKDIHTNTYELYAVSNHYGSMGGGHYTAYVKLLEEGRWYNFDDSLVSPVTEERIKTPAAYVLFYRRVTQESSIQNNKAH